MTTQSLNQKHNRQPLARRLLLSALESIDAGTLILTDGNHEHVFGRGAPTVRVQVNKSCFYRKVLLGGSVGAGESYMDADWDCDNLTNLIRLMAVNESAQNKIDGIKGALLAAVDRAQHLFRRNSRRGSARNIGAHYDLSNQFFEQFLDQRMMYSSAVFDADSQSLDLASAAKIRRLCDKLQLQPHEHLLEIGSGWGGLAIYAAQHYGCRVTTITVSRQQFEYARDLVAKQGLQDRIDIQLIDYRDVRGTYDKIVSVEMVEAVGHQYLDEYFAVLNRLVKPDGLIALQAITIRDHHYHSALRSVDFIKKHIFPGSFIPSLSALLSAAGNKSKAVLVNMEDFGPDYATTLARWRDRFEQNLTPIRELGFDDRFIRMWRFYLAYCEGGFLERSISDVQLLFALPQFRGAAWRKSRPANQ